MDSEDLNELERIIGIIKWRLTSINSKKTNAKSLTDYYELTKEIRREKENLINVLFQYKYVEQKYDLPVKLEYRHALKHLVGRARRK